MQRRSHDHDLVYVPIATWVHADGTGLALRRNGRLMGRRPGRAWRSMGRGWSIEEAHEFARGEAYARCVKQDWA